MSRALNVEGKKERVLGSFFLGDKFPRSSVRSHDKFFGIFDEKKSLKLTTMLSGAKNIQRSVIRDSDSRYFRL